MAHQMRQEPERRAQDSLSSFWGGGSAVHHQRGRPSTRMGPSWSIRPSTRWCMAADFQGIGAISAIHHPRLRRPRGMPV